MNNFIIKKNISESIYIAKFIAIVLVVFVHTYNFLPETMNSCLAANIEYIISRIIAASTVPLFFLFSSILLYCNNFNWFKNIKKKIYTLLIPYLILSTFTKQIWILIYIVFIAIDCYTIHLSINPLIRCFNSILGVYLIFVHISNINTKSLKDKLISLSAFVFQKI